ncbi:MAG: LPS assembly lipoprotein LptE [Pseudomonadota bacterium]
MSSSNRRQAILAAAGAVVTLSGCFRPMLAETSSGSGMRGKVALPSIDGRFGYYLNEALETRLGRPGNTAFRLEIAADLTEQGLAIAQDNTVTRVRLVAVANWALYRDGQAEPVLEQRTITQSGYDATASLFATRQTRLDIERRLARDIGERIARHILARSDRLDAIGTS